MSLAALLAACGRGDGGLADARYAGDLVTTIDEAPPATSAAGATFAFSTTMPATFTCQVDDRAAEPCASPWTTTVDVDGDHVFLVSATRLADGALERNPPTHAWRLDRHAPETVYADGPSGLTSANLVTISFGSDEPGVTYLCALDGAPPVACTSPHEVGPLADGAHTLVVTAVDPAGNADPTPLVFTWTVDATVPETVLDGGPPALVGPAPSVLTFSSPDAGVGGTFRCAVDGAPVSNTPDGVACASPFAFVAFAAGVSRDYVFQVRAVTAAGAADPSAALHVWEIDTTVPETTVTSAPSGTIGAAPTAAEFTSDLGVRHECSLVLDGEARSWAACTSPTPLDLPSGAYELAVRAYNRVDTVDPSPAIATFSVDATPPLITITATPTDPTPWRTPDAVAFTVDDPGATTTCEVLGQTAPVPCTSPWTTPRLPGGAATLRVVATDAVGNSTPSSHTWTVTTPGWTEATADRPSQRSASAVAFDAARGELVMFGGAPVGSYVNPLDDTWIWNGSTWTRRWPATSPAPRLLHAMAYDPVRAETILFGGSIAEDTPVADTWSWNGVTWTQRTPATSPSAREGAALTFDPSLGQLLLFGGTTSTTAGGGLADTWTWDGTTWTQLAPATSPAARSRTAMVAHAGSGRVILFGGIATNGVRQQDTWRWDGSTWSSTAPAVRPARRIDGALAVDPGGDVLLLGGSDAGGARDDVWAWDGAAWTATPATMPAGFMPAVLDTTRGELVVAHSRGETWTRAGGAWTQRTTPRPLRDGGYAMVYDAARGELVLPLARATSSETWIWDGADWTPRASATTLPTRIHHAVAYDAAREQVVVFGGSGDSTTWTWDGVDWTAHVTSPAPSPREFVPAAFDAARGEVVLFSGEDRDTLARPADTWTWDGAAWTQRFPATSPGGRLGHALAYDEARAQVVLFGGEGGSSTWTWDGTTWTQQPALTPRPPSLFYPTMTYAPAQERVLLFGGRRDSDINIDQLWSWDGVRWALESTLSPPPGRRIHGFAADLGRGELVVHGGRTNTTTDNADTWILR